MTTEKTVVSTPEGLCLKSTLADVVNVSHTANYHICYGSVQEA